MAQVHHRIRSPHRAGRRTDRDPERAVVTALRKCCHHSPFGVWMLRVQLRPGRPVLMRGTGVHPWAGWPPRTRLPGRRGGRAPGPAGTAPPARTASRFSPTRPSQQEQRDDDDNDDFHGDPSWMSRRRVLPPGRPDGLVCRWQASGRTAAPARQIRPLKRSVRDLLPERHIGEQCRRHAESDPSQDAHS